MNRSTAVLLAVAALLGDPRQPQQPLASGLVLPQIVLTERIVAHGGKGVGRRAVAHLHGDTGQPIAALSMRLIVQGQEMS